MKRFIIKAWHSETGLRFQLKDAGYQFNQELEWDEMQQAVKSIFLNGINIMLKNSTSDDPHIMWLDHGRFGQK